MLYSELLDPLKTDFVRAADTVILALGEDYLNTGERNSLSRPELDDSQIALAKRAKRLGKTVIAVVFAGRPLVLSELEGYADAILYAWHGGVMAAPAAVDILSGEFNPCGKAPMTFVRSAGQIPMYYNCQPMPIRRADINFYYDEAIPAYNDERPTPLYPFGFGLRQAGTGAQGLSKSILEKRRERRVTV